MRPLLFWDVAGLSWQPVADVTRQSIGPMFKRQQCKNNSFFDCFTRTFGRLRLKCDGTRAETRFHLWTKRTSPFKSAGGVSSVDYWQASCAHQPAGFVLLVQACVLQSCDAYWLPTPFPCFPFSSPSVRHRVPSHFNWTLPTTNLHRVTSQKSEKLN